MKLIIDKNRKVYSAGTWGTKNENNYEILNFEFPEELDGYNKRIVYYLDDEKVWDAIVDNKAYITNAITTKGDVKAYVWCTKENTEREADTDFRTQLFEMQFYENDNADGIVPTPEQVDGFNTMLTAMNNKIDEVDALEQTIGAVEAQRQDAEATRVSNENTRESNESTRQTNEQTRQSQEADRERRTDEAIADIQDKTAEYNANAEAKTTAFNNNATQKTNEFNSNYTQKVNNFNSNASSKETAFNSNASSKTSDFNSNAETKTNAFNTNATNKTNAFNSNATEKTTTFDDNASTKTSEFNTNAESKTSAFNDNATQKTTNFDNNASEKTDEFNTNAQEKIDEYDEHTEEMQQEIDELSANMPWGETEQATEIQVTDAAKYSRNKLELFGNTEQAFILPAEYTALDYIESTGTQYIDTGIIPNNTVGIYTKFQKNNANDKMTVGCREDSSNSRLFGTTTNNGIASFGFTQYYFLRKNGTWTWGIDPQTQDYINVDNNDIIEGWVNYNNSRRVNTNNLSKGIYVQGAYAVPTLDTTFTKTMYAFGYNNKGNVDYCSCRIYNIKITEGTSLVRDFIPCKNANNEIGMYDLIEGVFYTNQGTGSFIAGNEVTIPNPDHPQPIHVVTGNNSIGVQGKNLFNKNGNIVTGKYLDANGNAVNTTGSWYTEYYIPVSPNTDYIVSGGDKANRVCCYDENKAFIIRYNAETYKFSITTPNNCHYIRLSNNDEYQNLQLEQGSTATSYEPYYHADYPINLGSIELCKIGDYQDYLYKENGNWYKYGAIEKIIFDGTEGWAKSSTTNYDRFVNGTLRNITGQLIGLCTDLKYDSQRTKLHTFWLDNSDNLTYRGRIILNFSEYGTTTIAVFKTWLATKLPKFYIPFVTPTTTQITDETLISQLEAIYNHLALVKGTNNITVTAEDLAPYMELTYMQDLKSKLDNLDSRLSLLE